MLTKTYLKNLNYQVLKAAINVHKVLGPGLLDSVYHKCMKRELVHLGIPFESEVLIPINYRGLEIQVDLRVDLLIHSVLPVELKAVDAIHPIHEAQILTYMKLLQASKGLLINFNCCNIYQEGQRSLVNDLYRVLDD